MKWIYRLDITCTTCPKGYMFCATGQGQPAAAAHNPGASCTTFWGIQQHCAEGENIAAMHADVDEVCTVQTWHIQACSIAVGRYCRVAACADRHAIRRHPSQGHGLRQRAGDRRPGSGLRTGAWSLRFEQALQHCISDPGGPATSFGDIPRPSPAFVPLIMQSDVTPFEQARVWQWYQVNAYGEQRLSVEGTMLLLLLSTFHQLVSASTNTSTVNRTSQLTQLSM